MAFNSLAWYQSTSVNDTACSIYVSLTSSITHSWWRVFFNWSRGNWASCREEYYSFFQ